MTLHHCGKRQLLRTAVFISVVINVVNLSKLLIAL